MVVPIGTRSTGQGHETAYSQLITEAFGIDNELVTVIQGDTAAIENGAGTDGSRSLPAGGSALKAAIAKEDFETAATLRDEIKQAKKAAQTA